MFYSTKSAFIILLASLANGGGDVYVVFALAPICLLSGASIYPCRTRNPRPSWGSAPSSSCLWRSQPPWLWQPRNVEFIVDRWLCSSRSISNSRVPHVCRPYGNESIHNAFPISSTITRERSGGQRPAGFTRAIRDAGRPPAIATMGVELPGGGEASSLLPRRALPAEAVARVDGPAAYGRWLSSELSPPEIYPWRPQRRALCGDLPNGTAGEACRVFSFFIFANFIEYFSKARFIMFFKIFCS
jgi:hypothetical protein